MLTMKDVIREGHPTLRLKAQAVELPLSDEDKQTLFKMREFLYNSQNPELAEKHGLRPGVGLAAPQINVSKQMLAVLTDDENETLLDYMLINPKIISHSEVMTYLPTGEGCLSVDRDVTGFIPRYKRITIDAQQLLPDGSLKPIKLKLKDYTSIVFQHEIDHLHGVMFYDRINKENPLQEVPNGTPLEF